VRIEGYLDVKLQIPAIGYKQGGRQMVVTAMNPDALVKTVETPQRWNPVGSQPHGQRPEDRAHRKGIAEYLESEENFVIGAVVLYASTAEAKFVPDPDQQEEEAQRSGTLYLEYGGAFDIGDGQHRIHAYGDVISAHPDRNDPVMKRLHASGQPVIVVIDDSPLHRAQDFTDLQRNSKPLSASIGLSMDRRQPVNRLLIGLVQDERVPLLSGGDGRVEFLSDTPGKLSAKLLSYKAARFISGLVLGCNERTTKGWEKAVNAIVDEDEDGVRQLLLGFWEGLGTVRPYAELISGARTTAQVREATYLASAGVLYAVGWAAHLAGKENVSPEKFVRSLGAIDFARSARKPSVDRPLTHTDTIFAGTLVDPATGKISGSQNAWEPAAGLILGKVLAALN
jgi:DGQHR domain-containing protein